MLIVFLVRSLLCESIYDDDEILFDILISCGARADASFKIDREDWYWLLAESKEYHKVIDANGCMTLMHFVIITGKLDWIEKLMLLDMNIDGIDADGRTPLYYCETREQYDTLVSLGANEEFMSEELEHSALHSLHLYVPT